MKSSAIYLYWDLWAIGDVAGLAPLTGLTALDARAGSLSGDVAGLSPLTQMTCLSFFHGNQGVTGRQKRPFSPRLLLRIIN